ncbi:hypothetical protein HY969_00430 [Candidatus Kaiserbacteria bacterium]|nr:hypothetical protein [Candidatus Kaiserbacteria bacterium]
MVLQKAVDNLKDKSNDEKKAVASGVAIGVVVILLAAWGFLFVKKLQKGTELQLGGGAQSEFDFESVKKAQQQLKQDFQYSADELRAIRDSAVSGQVGTEVQTGGGSQSEPFDAPQDSF